MRENQKLPGGSSSGQSPFKTEPSAQPNWAELRPYWDKLVQKLALLHTGGGIALAFSGGMDSMVLLQICRQLGLDVLAVHCTGPQFSSEHSRQAVKWLEEHNIPHKVIEHNALSIPEVRHSASRRCYYCKTQLIKVLGEAAGERRLCDGTNSSDLQGYRPGLQALAEAGVHSPFLAATLSKPMIRRLAEVLELELPQSGGQNCLLTRFEYGVTASDAQLRSIEDIESALLRLLSSVRLQDGSIRDLQYRLRYLADGHAAQGSRAELHVESDQVLPIELLEKVSAVLSRHGLKNASVVVMPKVSGYFDKNLPEK